LFVLFFLCFFPFSLLFLFFFNISSLPACFYHSFPRSFSFLLFYSFPVTSISLCFFFPVFFFVLYYFPLFFPLFLSFLFSFHHNVFHFSFVPFFYLRLHTTYKYGTIQLTNVSKRDAQRNITGRTTRHLK
jgi:hypothetical protein